MRNSFRNAYMRVAWLVSLGCCAWVPSEAFSECVVLESNLSGGVEKQVSQSASLSSFAAPLRTNPRLQREREVVMCPRDQTERRLPSSWADLGESYVHRGVFGYSDEELKYADIGGNPRFLMFQSYFGFQNQWLLSRLKGMTF